MRIEFILLILLLAVCSGCIPGDGTSTNLPADAVVIENISLTAISETFYTDYKGKVCPPPTETIELNVDNHSGLTWALGTLPAHGTATLVGSVVSYVPNAGYTGTDSFTFSATTSGKAGSSTVSINIYGEDFTATQLNTTFSDLGESISYDAANPNHTGKGITEVPVVWNPKTQQFIALLNYKITTIGGCSGTWAFGRATSTDGVVWTEDASLVLDPNSFASTCSLSKSAFLYDGEYYHLFTQTQATSGTRVMDYFRSSDSISWTKITTVHSDSSIEFHESQVVKYNGELYVGFMSKSPTQDFYYVKGSGTTWTTPALIIDTSAFTSWNDGSFTSSKGQRIDMICSNNPNETPFIALLSLQGTASNYKYGSVTSSDFVTWTSSAHFTPTIITTAKWVTKSTMLRNQGDFVIWWSANDLQNAAWRAVFYGTTDSAWPSF